MEILKYSVVLALATWVVALAGVCVLQNVAPGNSKPLSLTWWHIWLEFAVLVAVLAAVLMKKVESWRLALLALLAVTTVQFMDLTENQLLVLDLLPSGSTGYSVSGLKCLFAGAISTSVLNFALIILLGVDSLSGGEKKAEEGKASAV